MAVHLLSDPEGLVCLADDEELALASGIVACAVRRILGRLEAAGWVATLDVPPGRDGGGRGVVLMDHEAADWYASETRRIAGARGDSAGSAAQQGRSGGTV